MAVIIESDGFAPPKIEGDETLEELLDILIRQQELIQSLQRDVEAIRDEVNTHHP